MTDFGTDKNFGTLLREAREKKEIPLAWVAERIKVSQSCLKALELGCWEELPPEIFVRGFVRSYARAIGVSEREPLNLLDSELASRRRKEDDLAVVVTGATHELLPVDGPPAEPDIARKPVGLAIFVVVVLVISIVALSYLLQQPPPPGEGLSQLETAASSAVASLTHWLPLS